MSLKKRAVQSILVAGSLLMMCTTAKTVDVVTVETANTTKINHIGATAGVVSCLVQIEMEALDEMQAVSADVWKHETNLVASAYGISAMSELTEEQLIWESRLMADVNEFLYVRAAADENAEIIGKMYKGDVAEIVEVGEEWTHIVSGNVDGYVKNEYCVAGQDALEYASANLEKKAEIQTNGLRVRSEADAESSVITAVSSGETLKVDTDAETSDEWVAVKYDGKTAYVSAEYVTTEYAVGEAITIKEEKEAQAKAAAEAAAAAAKTRQVTGAQKVQNAAVEASVDDVTLLAALIQCEAGNEPYEGQLAVGAVVMNRVRSGAFPGSVYGVIYQNGQFPPAAKGMVAGNISRGPKASCIQAAQEALSGVDNTAGALYFKRASSGHAGVVIGNHVFY